MDTCESGELASLPDPKINMRVLALTLAAVMLAPNAMLAVQANNQNPEVQYNLLDIPSSRKAIQELNGPARVLWENKPLREGLQELSSSHRLALWIDRRIDPNTPLTLQAGRSATLTSVLKQIEDQTNSEMGLLEGVLYIGPEGILPRLQRAQILLHDQVSSANNGRVDQSLFSWEELSTPSGLLQAVAEKFDTPVQGELPHDLLHAGNAGSCSMTTQLILICSGFDVIPKFSSASSSFTLVPLQIGTSWSCTYQREQLGPIVERSSALSKLARTHRGKVRRNGQLLEVHGPSALHQALLSKPVQQVAADASSLSQKTVKSLEVRGKSAEDVLKNLALSTGINLKWEASVSAEQRATTVGFKIENVSIDDILELIGEKTGLKMSRTGFDVTITSP
ncbi:MAG: hypothetical protein AAF483_26710 [Planctomycetota bacterium]